MKGLNLKFYDDVLTNWAARAAANKAKKPTRSREKAQLQRLVGIFEELEDVFCYIEGAIQ